MDLEKLPHEHRRMKVILEQWDGNFLSKGCANCSRGVVDESFFVECVDGKGFHMEPTHMCDDWKRNICLWVMQSASQLHDFKFNPKK